MDYTKPSQQTIEYYEVDRATWREVRPITTVTSAEITRDSGTDVLESAKLSTDERLPETYVRAYLVSRQGGEVTRDCLGTWLVQTPRRSFDGRVSSTEYDCYSSLLPASKDLPPLGHYMGSADGDVAEAVGRMVGRSVSAPVVVSGGGTALAEDLVADTDETVLDFAKVALKAAKAHLDVMPDGTVVVAPDVPNEAKLPSWTFADDGSSILLPDCHEDLDLYDVPNVVEVVWTPSGGSPVHGSATNDDPNSATSTTRRGRRVVKRMENPEELRSAGDVTAADCAALAAQKLTEASTVEHSVTIQHGFAPVRLGDCIAVRYSRAGVDVTGTVKSMTVHLETGVWCETTVSWYETLWRGANE